jgi:hypothetical protein
VLMAGLAAWPTSNKRIDAALAETARVPGGG